MIVLKSTYDAAVKRASTSGKALSEMTDELIKGMKVMGFDPNVQPRHVIGNPETTAGKVLRLLRNAMADAHAMEVERDTAQRERDDYRADALKYRNSQAANQRRRMEALQRAARVALEAATVKPNGTTEAAGLGAH